MTDFSSESTGMMALGQRPFVLAVDLMHFYFDADSPMCLPSTASLESAARVIEAARGAILPVLHARTVFSVGGMDSGFSIYRVPALRLLIGDNDLNELMPEVAPRSDELVLTKQYESAFFGTTLATTMHAHGFDTAIIVGVTTSGGIRASAADAMRHGFFAAVVQEAVSDRTTEVHESNLFDIAAKYADVLGEGAAVRYLTGDS
ncbi:N-carbamoylsarcosine amidohydrolase [Parafrigoribacterium mesophilum]|uniref:isochorismatase family protein n=1 Tax=Parafrigoribacterium mesophilum TaxID=433646 RepID=UPI0031FDB70D